MCLIIDVNVASLVFAAEPSDDFEPVWTALSIKKTVAVYGGKLAQEYFAIKRIRRLLRELERKGSLRRIPDREVDAETMVVIEEDNCVSDDPHIIALARVARVRLLCSNDRELHEDFTNPALLQPQGSIYQRRSHRHLICQHCRKRR